MLNTRGLRRWPGRGMLLALLALGLGALPGLAGRATAGASSALTLSAPPAVAAAAAQPLPVVKVSAFNAISDGGIYLALDNGYFREQGIDAQLSSLQSATEVVAALTTGQVDVAGGSPSAGIYNAAARGISLRVVADKGSTPPGYGYIGLVLRKGLADQVRSFADLRGRGVAWAAYESGGTNVVTLERALAANGMTRADLRLTDLNFPDTLAALAGGAVDAGVLLEPLIAQAVERDIGTRFLGFDELYPDQQVATLMYAASFIDRDPQAARGFMVGYLRGLRAYNDAVRNNVNRAAVVEVLTRNTTVKDPALYDRMVFPGLNPRGLANVAGMEDDLRTYRQLGLVSDPGVSVANVVDHSFVEYALRQLGE